MRTAGSLAARAHVRRLVSADLARNFEHPVGFKLDGAAELRWRYPASTDRAVFRNLFERAAKRRPLRVRIRLQRRASHIVSHRLLVEVSTGPVCRLSTVECSCASLVYTSVTCEDRMGLVSASFKKSIQDRAASARGRTDAVARFIATRTMEDTVCP